MGWKDRVERSEDISENLLNWWFSFSREGRNGVINLGD